MNPSKLLEKSLEIKFYSTTTGKEPVKDWIKKLSKLDKKNIGEDIRTVQYTWPQIGKPLVEPIGKGLWEIRTNLTNKRIARIIFCNQNNYIILLHAFIKKTRKIPKKDMDLALSRKKQID